MTNLNLEHLINSVQERFEDFESFESKSNGYFKYNKESAKEYRYYERAVYHGNNYIRDVCQILNIDIYRLYSIVRAIRKWNEKSNWERCFPFQEHAEQIMKYLQQ